MLYWRVNIITMKEIGNKKMFNNMYASKVNKE